MASKRVVIHKCHNFKARNLIKVQMVKKSVKNSSIFLRNAQQFQQQDGANGAYLTFQLSFRTFKPIINIGRM